MPKLDYSHLEHSKKQPFNGYTRKESFYLQKGNGRAGSYMGGYKGDFTVFKACRQTIERNNLPKISTETENDCER